MSRNNDLEGFQEAMLRLGFLRSQIFSRIPKALERSGGHCKSYEGRIDVSFPNFFASQEGGEHTNRWSVELHLYLIGPHRHYDYAGETLLECVEKMEAEVMPWLEEFDRE